MIWEICPVAAGEQEDKKDEEDWNTPSAGRSVSLRGRFGCPLPFFTAPGAGPSDLL